MTPSVSPSLVAAAALLCGRGASRSDVEDTLIGLALMAEEESPSMRRVARVLDAQRFVAELTAVRIEESSTRAVLTLAVPPGPNAPEGVEQIRTDRTDTREGARLYRKAPGLVGHRVIVHKVLEDLDGQRKVRVAVHLVDLGQAVPPAGGSGPGECSPSPRPRSSVAGS